MLDFNGLLGRLLLFHLVDNFLLLLYFLRVVVHYVLQLVLHVQLLLHLVIVAILHGLVHRNQLAFFVNAHPMWDIVVIQP